MTRNDAFNIAVFAGDGIGPEVMDPCLAILDRVQQMVGNLHLSVTSVPAGAGTYVETGTALPDPSLETARRADAILLSAMGLPSVRYPDGTEVAPQIDLRFALDLYAGVRPIRLVPGMRTPLADPRAKDIDFVIIRESTEGLFASRGRGTVSADDQVAHDTMEITRKTSERLFDFSLALARRRREQGRPGRVTCVDKANVFLSFAFFRKIFDERAKAFPDLATDAAYVDATALNLVRQPWAFDVMVTENMFGDILSDLGAGLIGGMGMAPSADIGDDHAVFQPCHGTAPDIAGKGLANPTAMFLSAAMMLAWLGDRHNHDPARHAGRLLESAVDRAFANGTIVTTEHGGEAGTARVTQAVLDALPETPTPP